MTIIAPPKPMMMASQRRQPTFSRKNQCRKAGEDERFDEIDGEDIGERHVFDRHEEQQRGCGKQNAAQQIEPEPLRFQRA